MKNTMRWLRLKSLMIVGLYSFLSIGSAYGEDIEIFYGSRAQQKDTTPNILFIFDTSGSMTNRLANSQDTRIETMREVLLDFFDSLRDVNVGLARFTVPGGPILQPVMGVDEPVDPLVISNITSSENDASESKLQGGRMILGAEELKLANTHLTGLRFKNVDIPQGAKITSATLTFSAADDSTGETQFSIAAEASDDAQPFLNSAKNLSNRPKTRASVAWKPESWELPSGQDTTPKSYSSSDVTSVIQEVVDRNGWCGGHSMALFISAISGTRVAHAYDSSNSNGFAPRLRIEFDRNLPPGANGCFTVTESVAVNKQDYDFYYDFNQNSYNATDSLLRFQASTRIGLYFDQVNIPDNANLLDSYIELVAYQDDNTNLKTTIRAVNSGKPPSKAPDIIRADKTSASVDWQLNGFTQNNERYRTDSLNDIVLSLIKKSDWKPKNAMAFWMDSVTGWRNFRSAGSPSRAPRLVVRYKTVYGTDHQFTRRDILKASVNDFIADGSTPISDTLLEAGLYFRGEGVLYGKDRGAGKKTSSRISSPEALEASAILNRGDGCFAGNLDSEACRDEHYSNSPNYVSPITDQCQSNHIVLLTDGEPTSHSQNTNSTYNRWTNQTCENWDSGSDCSVKIARFLGEEDQRANLPEKQIVKTHTIGFDFSHEFLENVASAGGGSYVEANSREELLQALQNLTDSVSRSSNSFVSVGVTVNQYNRVSHAEEIYFSLFQPEGTASWPGNVKRYRLDQKTRKIVDKEGNVAIDPNTGYFNDGVTSYWSGSPDGSVIARGGVAGRLEVNRKIYTQLGGEKSLTADINKVVEDNGAITANMLGVGSDAERTKVIQWARGYDVDGADPAVAHKNIGDPLHSQPVLVAYPNVSAIYAGTNHGFVHSFDSTTGKENWAFIPEELLKNLNVARENETGASHLYGIDGSATVYHIDTDDDGVVDSGEKAYLYIGMRRGGDSYYALDISDYKSPRLMFSISNDTAGYEKLGQTWSKPVIGKMKIGRGGGERLVMVFGGGYDLAQDTEDTSAHNDKVGNRVYIADALTGSKIWDSTKAKKPANAKVGLVSTMNGVPGDVKIFDLDGDGLFDKFYVADTKAQVFRFDIDNEKRTITGGRIAQLGDTDNTSAKDNRRFFYNPDASINQDVLTGRRYITLAIGSGYRAHPLNAKVEDRFFVIRDEKALSNEWIDELKIDDLLDVTNVLGDADKDGVSDAAEGIKDKDLKGWYITFKDKGEKVLASAVTFNGIVQFTTYIPPTNHIQQSCKPPEGNGRAYTVNIADGMPFRGDNFSGTLDPNDRYIDLNSSGIPSQPQILLPQDGKPLNMFGPEIYEDLLPELPKTLMPIRWRHKRQWETASSNSNSNP
ncbi:PilC/PilY family type IV pilus protein [Pleionea sp. CnH1-48]|uniref:PilC/PilY family type IV pilus protein n=1 Tax=Pleionea sp. CnH1-48 TaxID=2954494 RepID=UPI0020982DC9|nr:PilC/PilY family type IV pilus protein [Pleionea sp. CnH1-48]MCO7222867.1 PilC/PilY family type IV pilus protein [Pleionea sp. CnH1-48]